MSTDRSKGSTPRPEPTPIWTPGSVHPGLAVAACVVLSSGCVASGKYTPPAGSVEPKQHERVVNKSFDETWTSLVDYASGAFFAIDRFEKASGLLTLSFGTSEPWRYIECGHIKGQTAAMEPLDQPYAQFLVEQYGAKLDGRMNILVRPDQAGKTLVRVNARYVFSVPANELFSAESWAFDSGSDATVTVSNPFVGSPPARTCRPTYVAERAVLDAVEK